MSDLKLHEECHFPHLFTDESPYRSGTTKKVMICSTTSSIILFILANIMSVAIGATYCKRSCGREVVNYPFGFSEGCEIRLNCNDSVGVEIGNFLVRNVTSDVMMVNFPANCHRRVEEMKVLFGPNYAVSWQNALLLHGCSSSAQNNCTIPTVMLENRFHLRGCGSENVSCSYPVAPEKGVGMLTYENINSTVCKLLFSSIVVNPGIDDSDVSLELQTIELDWWLLGDCRCSFNADCRPVTVQNGSSGYRCYCRDGFVGDGFAQGSGCHTAAGDNSKKTMIPVLIGGIIAGASTTVGLVVFICCFMRGSEGRVWFRRQRRCAKHDLLYEASSVVHYPYKEIERATCSFSDQKRLGTGAYGTVYEGRLSNDECVAIKKIKKQEGSESIEQVMNEIKLISCVSHPNLVRLLGCCIENGEQILVYEFMANGTLCQHLQREKGKVLPWTVRLTIATETAQAIAHLHSTPIYHRDIKSSNILLDSNYNAKVADFGLSRVGMADSSHISTGPQGTPGYVDPQYHQNYHLSDKSDVYSFGVVLMEMITAMKVVDFSRPNAEINLAALAVERIRSGRLDEIVDPFIDPHRDAWTLNSIHKVAELGFRCLAYHRDMRPSMPEVADELESIRLSAWEAGSSPWPSSPSTHCLLDQSSTSQSQSQCCFA